MHGDAYILLTIVYDDKFTPDQEPGFTEKLLNSIKFIEDEDV